VWTLYPEGTESSTFRFCEMFIVALAPGPTENDDAQRGSLPSVLEREREREREKRRGREEEEVMVYVWTHPSRSVERVDVGLCRPDSSCRGDSRFADGNLALPPFPSSNGGHSER
jgi:hypothetical protein